MLKANLDSAIIIVEFLLVPAVDDVLVVSAEDAAVSIRRIIVSKTFMNARDADLHFTPFS